MVIDLLPAAYAGIVTSAVLARNPGISGVLVILAEGRANAAFERERRITMALALRQLPQGVCVAGRDASGQEWFIGPAVIANSTSM